MGQDFWRRRLRFATRGRVGSGDLRGRGAAAAGFPDVEFIDLTDELCPEDVCRTMLNGLVMYRDTHHLAGTAATVNLTPRLEPRVIEALAR
jgi:SGNH domain (fused to AT3 domains)